MLREALTWWTAQLFDLVPATLTRPDPAASGALLVEPSAGAIRLVRRRGVEEIPLGAFPAGRDDASLPAAIAASIADDPVPVLLSLPPDAALIREVTLPLAAEAGLDRVLVYEMDRLTPFSADETFFTWSVLRRDREAGRLQLRLSLVLRKPLMPLLDSLSAAGISPAGIEVPGGLGQILHIPLAHLRPASAVQTVMAAAAAGCAVLALLAIVLPFILQSMETGRIDREMAALQPRVARVQTLQRQISGSSAGAELVVAERQRLGDTLSVLASLTRLLPDDTYLSDLTLRGGQLTLSGQSPAAARLIQLISADPAFSAPAFSAPVTRIEGQGTDLFSIRAGIAH